MNRDVQYSERRRRSPDAEYHVKIKAKVSDAMVINKAIEEVVASQGKPRMMVLRRRIVQRQAPMANKVAQTETRSAVYRAGLSVR
jgi:transketolase